MKNPISVSESQVGVKAVIEWRIAVTVKTRM